MSKSRVKDAVDARVNQAKNAPDAPTQTPPPRPTVNPYLNDENMKNHK